MMKKPIKNYLTSPIISDSIPNDDFDFLTHYRGHKTSIDHYFITQYGTLQLDEVLEGNTETITKTNVTNEIKNVMYVYQENINRLWEINKAEYNPLWNVDGTEKTTTVYGATEDSFSHAQKETDMTIGARHSENLNGAFDVSTTNKTTGFNTDTFQDNNKSITSQDSFTNTTDTESATDKTVEKAYTDKNTSKEHTVTEIRERGGNIGVTKSTELLSDQFQLFGYTFNFYKWLFELIFSSVAIPLYTDL